MAADETKSEASKLKGEGPKAKRKRRGASKRSAQRRVGRPVSMQPIALATPAKSAAAQEANGRTAVAAGRKERADAETNTQAFKAIKSVCVKFSVGLDARGLPAVVVHGAELLCERLAVIVEVEAMSATAAPTLAALDDAAFLSKRRDAILRVAPGPANSGFRAKFGLNQPVRANQPKTLKAAAQRLLAGRKAEPKSRAAQLLTSDDEKRLRAIVKSVNDGAAETKKARTDGLSRTTERNILNAGLELFYDDFAASIGLVLEGDEVARLHALELIPRRPERRKDAGKGDGAGGAAGGTSGGATSGAGAAAQGATPAPAGTVVATT